MKLMNRFIKQLLLWFLIAALPIQGMAAVVKANCGSRHHAVSVSLTAESAMPAQHVQGVHDEKDSSHAHGVSNVAKSPILADDASLTDPSQSGSHHASYCSACAACCTGAVAPPVSFSAISIPDRVVESAVSPVVSYLGFIPPSLERPPKTFFA